MPTSATTRPLVLPDIIDPDLLLAEVEAGYISRKPHPSLPLAIYTYTRACQYERRWNPATIHCRGLVIEDTTDAVIALPFPKFWNIGEFDQGHDYAPALPSEPFEIFSKMDGSLGIVFNYDGRWHAASKGSFISEQAVWATRRLTQLDHSKLIPGYTYLAEILYPENRIVVNYGDRKDLVLLAAYRPNGTEAPLGEVADTWAPIGSVVTRWPNTKPLADIAAAAAENMRIDGLKTTGTDAEGYVIRFASGLRAKCKFSEYCRLHKALTGTNARDIWRYLGAQLFADQPPKRLGQTLGCSPEEAASLAAIEGGALRQLLEQVPDEFDTWVRGVVADIEMAFVCLCSRIADEFTRLTHLHDNRAAFAAMANQIDDRTVRAGLFQMLDGRDINLLAWKAVKPEPSDPFKVDEEG